MRILVIGGNGQVGTELRRALKPLGELIVTTRSGESLDGQASLPCDLAIPGSAHNLIDGLQPDIVVNATA